MKETFINNVVQRMLPFLNNDQLEKLYLVIQHEIFNYDLINKDKSEEQSEQNYIDFFISSKK